MAIDFTDNSSGIFLLIVLLLPVKINGFRNREFRYSADNPKYNIMKTFGIISFVFSPLVTALIAGYFLLRYTGIQGKTFALITIAGLFLSMLNGAILIVRIRKK
jgi:hypothetical protein